MSPARSITPETRKTMIRRWVLIIAARNEPGPDPLRLVTTSTTPPRPPVVSVPKPCAPGNAGRACAAWAWRRKGARRAAHDTKVTGTLIGLLARLLSARPGSHGRIEAEAGGRLQRHRLPHEAPVPSVVRHRHRA